MLKISLTVGVLSLKNLKAKPVRTACLVVVVAILAFTLFGGSILALNLQQGLTAMTQRFGADIMVVPQGTAEKAQSLLLRGGANYFYFDAGIVNKVSQMEGVVCASPQFFLTSLSESCCDDMVQLIAYDPETDFVIQPWIAEKFRGQVEDGQLVVGSGITIRNDNTVMLLNHKYPVAARLSRSASGLDTSVFMTMNTMQNLMRQARTEGYGFLAEQEKKGVRGLVSAVLAKIDPAANPSWLASDIRKQNEGVDVLVSQSIFTRISESLSGVIRYIRFFSLITWVLAVVILAAVFSGAIHERKKEFATLRILGATRKKLIGLVLSESSLAAIIGGIAGIVLASLAVFPFSALISEKLELPYFDAPFLHIVLIALGSLFLSAMAGALSALYTALHISKAETYFTLREGE
ncbi:MAG: ABC transporter permease [Treponema sp.]|jgi:putative ABC transport system permease protein|nr:ABC transporter permease [Treponema sp.]